MILYTKLESMESYVLSAINTDWNKQGGRNKNHIIARGTNSSCFSVGFYYGHPELQRCLSFRNNFIIPFGSTSMPKN